jgi:hypothetical protein
MLVIIVRVRLKKWMFRREERTGAQKQNQTALEQLHTGRFYRSFLPKARAQLLNGIPAD